MEERRFDPVKGRQNTRIVLLSQGRKVVHNLDIRWYSIPELEQMLKDAGINVCGLYGGLDSSEYELGAMRLIVVGEKV